MAVHLLDGLYLGIRNSEGDRPPARAPGPARHAVGQPGARAEQPCGCCGCGRPSQLRERVADMRHKLGDDRRGQGVAGHDRLPGRPCRRPPSSGPPRPATSPDPDAGGRPRGRRSSTGSTSWGSSRRYDLASVFVAAGLDVDWLDGVVAELGEDQVDGALRWLAYTLETESLMDEIAGRHRPHQHAGRRGQAVRLHGRLAPCRTIDVHVGLDSTVVMLGHKLQGVEVRAGVRPDAAEGARLRRRAEPGVDQPDRQRGRRDGRTRAPAAAHASGRRLRRGRRRRRRSRDPRRRPAAGLRRVLHHQGAGGGQRPRARERSPHRREAAPRSICRSPPARTARRSRSGCRWCSSSRRPRDEFCCADRVSSGGGLDAGRRHRSKGPDRRGQAHASAAFRALDGVIAGRPWGDPRATDDSDGPSRTVAGPGDAY